MAKLIKKTRTAILLEYNTVYTVMDIQEKPADRIAAIIVCVVGVWSVLCGL